VEVRCSSTWSKVRLTPALFQYTTYPPLVCALSITRFSTVTWGTVPEALFAFTTFRVGAEAFPLLDQTRAPLSEVTVTEIPKLNWSFSKTLASNSMVSPETAAL